MTFPSCVCELLFVILKGMDDNVSVGCLLVTRLPAKAALLARPELAGRAFVVYGRDGLVAAASPEAAGARVGAPLSEVLSACADAEPVPFDDQAVSAIHRSLFESLCGGVPGVEPAGSGMFYLDLSGMARLLGSPEVLAGNLLSSCSPVLRPRLGLASGKFPARVAAASAPPGGWLAVPGCAASWLAPKPVSLLPVDAAVRRRLARFGVRRLGDLSRIPRPALSEFLGGDAERLAMLARGDDTSPVIPAGPPETLERRTEFPFPMDSIAGLEAGLRGLCEGLWSGGALSGRQAGEASLSGALSSGGSWRFSRSLRFPAASADALFRYLSASVSWPGDALLDLTLSVSRLSFEMGVRKGLWPGFRESTPLPEGVFRPVLLERGSVLPERSWGLGESLRPLFSPRPAEVDAAGGCSAPARVRLGRWRRVEAVADRWELDTGWWGPEPVRRGYWSLTLEGGRTATVFFDFLDGLWYRQGG